jgi:uncharacterized protein with HEPN domain
MQRDPRAFLWDVREAALAIQSFTAGMDAAAFAANEMALSAVERKFEIIGEALNQLAKLDATLAARIPDLPRIVAFRNRRTAAVWAAKLANQFTVTETAIWLKLRKLSQAV